MGTSRRLSTELRTVKHECAELHQELRAARAAQPKPKPSPPALPPSSTDSSFVTPGMSSVQAALEKVRAENIARLGLVSDAPPGLGPVPRAAGPSAATLRSSLSRYLARVPPSARGGSPAADPDQVSRTSRAADPASRTSRAAGRYDRVMVGPPGGPPDGGDDGDHDGDKGRG
jgi:hypothetical protein